MPTAVGSATPTSVHFRRFDSRASVSVVVPQGKWNSEKSSIQSAVVPVQPFASSMVLSSASDAPSTSVPAEE